MLCTSKTLTRSRLWCIWDLQAAEPDSIFFCNLSLGLSLGDHVSSGFKASCCSAECVGLHLPLHRYGFWTYRGCMVWEQAYTSDSVPASSEATQRLLSILDAAQRFASTQPAAADLSKPQPAESACQQIAVAAIGWARGWVSPSPSVVPLAFSQTRMLL